MTKQENKYRLIAKNFKKLLKEGHAWDYTSVADYVKNKYNGLEWGDLGGGQGMTGGYFIYHTSWGMDDQQVADFVDSKAHANELTELENEEIIIENEQEIQKIDPIIKKYYNLIKNKQILIIVLPIDNLYSSETRVLINKIV